MQSSIDSLPRCGAIVHGPHTIKNAINSIGRKLLCSASVYGLLFVYFMISAVTAGAQGPNFEWAKSMGGTDFDNGYALTVDESGNTYTTGLFRGTADFDPGPDSFKLTSTGGNNLFIAKLDAAGNFVWAKKFGSPKFNYSYSITHDASNNIYVTGYFIDTVDFDPGPNVFTLTSGSTTISDVFILKLDSAGEFVWAKKIGGTSNDQAYSITTDPLNNIYVTGKFFGVVDFDPGPNVFNITPLNSSANIFILKLNSSGDFVWAKDMGQVTRPSATATGFSIAVDDRSNVYSTGYFRDTIDFDPGVGQAKLISKGLDDIFISKLDSAGNFMWAKSVGSSRADQGLSIALDPAHNVYVTGVFNDTVDFNPGAGTFNLIANNAADLDIFILKLDTDGEFVWAKSITGATNTPFEDNYSFSISADKAGNTYTTGYFFGNADFDPGPTNTILSSAGASDVFILKLNAAGAFVWVKKMGGVDINVSRSSIMDGSGNLYTTGWFRGTSDFDPGAGVASLTSKNNSMDIVVVKLSCGDTSSIMLTETANCNGYLLIDTTYTETGVYVQTVPNAQGCDSVITLNLTIIPVLDMDITITTDANKLGTLEHFTTYQWIFNGQAIQGATDSTYTATQNGAYRVTVTNEHGCRDTSDVYAVTNITGIEDMSALAGQIKIYPNPAHDMLFIKSPVGISADISGIEGRHIMSIQHAESFSIKSLPAGVYLLRITNKSGVLIQTVKIVKQ